MPFYLKLVASLLLTLVIALPVTFLSMPSLILWNMSRKLVSSDQTQRQQALNYVAHRADHQPEVRDMAIESLSVPDDIHFQQIFHALDIAGQWKRPAIPNDAWLRWLTILGNENDPEARIMAIRQSSSLDDLAQDEHLLALLQKWMADSDPLVRYNTLIALADLSSHASETAAVQKLLASMTDDKLPAIAAEAWLFLGLIDPASGRSANWMQSPPEVAAAILWATMRTNPDQPAPALMALTDAQTPAIVQAFAAYVLHMNQAAEKQQDIDTALMALISPHSQTNFTRVDPQVLTTWRAIGSIKTAVAIPAEATKLPEAPHYLLWSVLNEHARVNGLDETLQPLLTPERLSSHPVSSLAILEGLKPASAALGSCPPEAPPFVRLAWARAAINPEPALLRDLFASDSAPLRDSACVIAADRFDDAANNALIISLLSDFNDNAKCSGAILAGLTGLRPSVTRSGVTHELLPQKMEDEDMWAVKQVMRIGLWMQDQLPEVDEQITGLLSREDLPISTLMLALLKRQPDRAMNELFSPLTDPPMFKARSLNARNTAGQPATLMELLVQYRWLHVLQAMVPDHETTLWLWADTDLQAFQMQIIRNHWLLSRPRD